MFGQNLSKVRFFMLLSALLSFFGANAVWAHEAKQDESLSRAQAWIARMLNASQSQTYQGLVVLGDDQYWSSYEVRHGVINKTEYEYIKQLTGSAQETIRKGQELVCSHDEDFGQHRPLRHPLLPHENLLKSSFPYQITLGHQARIAGREAQQLIIQPLDHHRYTVHLWLDTEHALLLGSTLNQGQEVLERAQYASIDFSPKFNEASFQPSQRAHQQRLTTDSAPNHWQPSVLPHWIPEGFELVFFAEKEQSTRLRYFDGLVSFSLFLDHSTKPFSEVVQQWGATSAVVVEVGEQEQRQRVTAVGELPVASLKKIVLSLAPVVE